MSYLNCFFSEQINWKSKFTFLFSFFFCSLNDECEGENLI